MGSLLPDGTVVPSYLGLQDMSAHGDSGVDNDIELKIGEVQRIVWPKSQEAREGQNFIEYDVLCRYFDRGSTSSKTYSNCIAVNPFGGVADKLIWTFRAATQKEEALGKGAKVLLLCVGGNAGNAVIIGGVQDEQDTPLGEKAKTDLGHHLHFVFNGLDCFINQDGELVVTCKGATTPDGKPTESVDSALVGTKVELLQDGSFQVRTKDDAEQLLINRKDGKVIIKAENGVHVGKANEAWMLGTTYRTAEAEANKKLAANFQALQALLQVAATALITAGGSLPTPLTGPALAAPQFSAAGTALQSAAQLAGQMGQAITAMEAQADAFLSKNNRTD